MPRPHAAAPPDHDRQVVTALARGLDILRCFTATRPELGVSAIARLTGLPQPTAWRLCHTLVARGFLTRVPGRDTLRPGIPLLGLGYAVLSGQPVAQLALPEMQALADRHAGGVSLGARDGLSMVYLQRCQGTSIVLDLRVGSRVPIGTSATGWAYLAALPDAERDAVLAELRAAEGPRWAAIEPRLHDAIRDYARRGYIVNKGLLHPRINSVAAPVFAPDGTVALSLSAGGIDTGFDDATLASIGASLTSLAARLGPALGAP